MDEEELPTCLRPLLSILVPLLVRDVFVGHKEQNHFPLLILNGHDVQETPELSPCRGADTHCEKTVTAEAQLIHSHLTI